MKSIEDILAGFLAEVVRGMDRVHGKGVCEGEEPAAVNDLAGEFEGSIKKYSKKIKELLSGGKFESL
jgi:hypothetical protein